MPQRELAGPCAETCPDCRKDTRAIFDTVPQCHTWAWGQQHTCCPHTAALAHHVTHPTIAARRCSRILTMTTRAHGGLLGVQCSATPRGEPCGLPPVAPSQLRGRFRCSSLGGVASPGCSCSCSRPPPLEFRLPPPPGTAGTCPPSPLPVAVAADAVVPVAPSEPSDEDSAGEAAGTSTCDPHGSSRSVGSFSSNNLVDTMIHTVWPQHGQSASILAIAATAAPRSESHGKRLGGP